ncbi:Zn-dependent alcohol dehydrogenase [Arthrobacter sp. I2-34]|uniref:Zn-dependent alcohol dehydrogenase n=1 Tax=Arthrobacter hankyongi TaxID=2904801 RepID=A0ABS9L911_9MICC|nr:Zn-dependent alcohol dehydrogenase [Arthrobacter hankyongi]MCG2623068.1 Zn-dependent alcohol dehydrogenase [Arthrobacter hankyongi]
MHFKAAVFDGPGTPLAIEELSVESPRFGEVLVRMTASGVCHSDYHVVLGEWGAKFPLVLGHEGAGVIVETGPGVSGLQIGDAVALSWTPSCRRCRYCVSGRPQLCSNAVANAYRNVLPDGTTRLRRNDDQVYSYLSVGSFAEYAVVPESGAVRIADGVDPAIAALVGCAVTTGVGAAINTAPVAPGSTVAVIGAGGVGLSTIMGAALQAPERIIAVDLSDEKLDLARRAGATHTVHARDTDVVEAIKDLTGGDGVDHAFEAIGRAETIEQAYASLAPGGTAVVVGQVPTGVKISIDPMVMSGRELTLTGSNYGSSRPSIDFARILGLHSRGLLPLDLLVDRRIQLQDINTAFDAMGQGTAARTVIEFP